MRSLAPCDGGYLVSVGYRISGLYSLNGNTLEETEFTSTRGVSLNQEILNWPEFVVYLLMVLVLGTPAPRHRVVRTLTAHSLAA